MPALAAAVEPISWARRIFDRTIDPVESGLASASHADQSTDARRSGNEL